MPDTPEHLPDAVRHWAERDPSRTAVELADQKLSYAELAARTARLAARLRGLGVGPDVVVGLAAGRSFELVTGILGILDAGGAWLPLDPTYPAARLRYMLEDAGAELLLVNDAVADRVHSGTAIRIGFDAETGPSGPTPAQADDDRPLPGHLAYVIYTSGSTGRPKGVMVTWGGLANLTAEVVSHFGLGAHSRVLQFAPSGFDASVWEIAPVLRAGGTLVLVRARAAVPGPELARLLHDARITDVVFPPSVLAALPEIDLPDLRNLVCAGEALPGSLVARWGRGRRFVNAYGPTETTVAAAAADVGPGTALAGGKPPIGWPFAGARLVVMGPDLRPVPPGQVGELAIGGPGTARGYRGRPGLTADRYVPDPEPPAPGARLYRTGDLVRLRPTGDLEYLGRIDEQIKWHGFRIEPGEIRAVLDEHPAVADAAIVLRSDGGVERLVAYVVSRPAAEASPALLRAFLAERLPVHMVPTAIMLLPALPLTPSGKIDRTALPAPDRAGAGLTAPTPPRRGVERALADIVADLLGTPDVGAHDDFFALGGHSLLVGRLVSRIRADLGVELPVRTAYECPTVAELAARVAGATGTSELPPMRRARRAGPIPLSLPQERVWFLEQLAPRNLAYNAQATIRLTGPLDVEALTATLTELVRRHAVLRTRFRAVDGVPRQEPLPPIPIRLPIVDVSEEPAARREARAEEIMRAAFRRPFHLDRPPLVRWILIRHTADCHTLVHVEHHFGHDGWSFALLLDELKVIYPAFAAGRPSPLPDPAFQFADFATWQREWMRGDVLRRYVDHWTAKLDGHRHSIELPMDRPRLPIANLCGDMLPIGLPPALGDALRAFGREHRVSLFATMLAGFAVLLGRYSGAERFIVGSGVANRRLAESERIVGMVVNTLALPIDLSGRPSFATLARRLQEMTLDAHDWGDVPLESVVEALAPERDPSRNPLFQTMFSFHDSAVPDLDFAGLRGELRERHNGSAKTDLNVVIVPRAEQRTGRSPHPDDERITLLWEYATSLFDEPTMRRMADHYLRLLEAGVREPHCEVHRLPLLSPAEARLLAAWGEPADPAPPPVTAADPLARPPDDQAAATAIRAPGATLTYGELHHLADRWAARLRDLGVGPERRVAVLAARSPELVAAALAVLKAGAAYVPIDPAYPSQRIARIISDARVMAILAGPGARRAMPVADGLAPVPVLDFSPAAHGEVAAEPVRVAPDHLAYVIYTSGSTGTPKGVQITRASLANLVRWHLSSYRLGPDDRCALLSSPGFDASVWEIWPALAAGATLCVPPEEVRLSPAELVDWLGTERITVCFLPTPMAEAVLDMPWPGETSLRLLLTGGDVLRRSPDRRPPFRLVNHYGPAENTVIATADPVAPGESGRPPIGRPISGVVARVLDGNGEPVPTGIVGELCLGGAGLARGYLGQPGHTAERFVPDPFARRAGERLYRTGDLVCWRPDGSLDFRGRADDQVQIRGVRVEPGEVAATLRDHPAVWETVVVGRENARGDRWLAAYVVVAEGKAVTAEELRELARSHLPAAMVPTDLVFLDRLPLTAHGKVDRAALPTPVRHHGGTAPPRTPVEERLAELAAELLGVGRIGCDQDFFAAGGHSMLAGRLVARANATFGVHVPLSRFLGNPTVADLARAVDEAQTEVSAGAPAAAPIPARVGARDATLLLDRLDDMSDEESAELLSRIAESEVDL